jgi:N4-gp56 family major capsid protein
MFRSIADKKPAQQAMPGSSVVFELYSDLAKQTATLSETVDVDAVAIANPTLVTVTLAEYGAAVLNTRRIELFSLSDVKPAIANQVAYNMLNSVDDLVLTVLRGGTNVVKEAAGVLSTSAATNTITGTDTFKSRDVRYVVAKLRANSVIPRKGNLYWCAIDPEVSHDLRAETGSAAWRDPHVYSAPGSIWAGEIGQYEGAFFVETPRGYNATDGATSTRVFRTLFAGQQALAEAVAEDFHVVVGNVTDKLKRFTPIGWYGVAGWSIYRQAALYRVETTSSIHNT